MIRPRSLPFLVGPFISTEARQPSDYKGALIVVFTPCAVRRTVTAELADRSDLNEDDMALTIPQLQSNLDAINQALGNPTLRVRFPDGREVTYRSVDELRKAKAEIEEDIRQASGKSGSRTTLAQHKRGDGPGGPSLYDRW
jgi:hypothetical protein